MIIPLAFPNWQTADMQSCQACSFWVPQGSSQTATTEALCQRPNSRDCAKFYSFERLSMCKILHHRIAVPCTRRFFCSHEGRCFSWCFSSWMCNRQALPTHASSNTPEEAHTVSAFRIVVPAYMQAAAAFAQTHSRAASIDPITMLCPYCTSVPLVKYMLRWWSA